MSDSKEVNFVQKVVVQLIEHLDWVRETLAQEEVRRALEGDLGGEAGKFSAPSEEKASIKAYREAATRGDALDKQAALAALADLLATFEAIYTPIASTNTGSEAAELVQRRLSLLLLGYARVRYPFWHKLGELLGFIEEATSPHLTEKVYFDRVPEFLSDTKNYFKRVFGPLDTEADAKSWSDRIFPIIATILAQQGNKEEEGNDTFLPAVVATKNVIYGWDAAPDSTTKIADEISGRAFSVEFEYTKQDAEEGSEAKGTLNVTLLLVPREHGGPGVFAGLGGAAEFEGEMGGEWRMRFAARAVSLDFLIGKNMMAGGAPDARASISAGPKPESPTRKYVVPDAKGTRLEFGRLELSAEITERGAGFEFTAEDGALIISGGECDSYVAQALPAKETRIDFNLGLGVSSERGFYLTGGTGLQAVIPVGKSIGPTHIQQLLVKLTPSTGPKPARLTFEASAAFNLKMGPVTATIDQLGMRALVPFEKSSDGKWNFDIGFKPPTGVGLKIESPAVTGGGFLFHDAANAQYGGVIQLELTKSKISLKAVGIISTRLPGGAKGFSLLVIITAEGFKPIPLGLGFMLTGIGGLLAINRTFNEDAVREAVKGGAMERILFPQDPIRNAPQIISSINSLFPTRKGSYLFGPLVKISWGAASVLKMELALIFEMGERFRLIVLGRASVVLPKEDNDLVRLKMDAIGIIDFDQGTASLDAALYDSRLAKKFVLTGSMAMRLKWTTPRVFALSVGGFHPAFKPPAGFPALERIALSLSESEDFRLRCEGYFALTSNTLQFGANAELLARAGGFSIHGQIGFDVLIQFDPFTFVAGFHASVQLKRGSTNLFKVSVEGELSGPRPLHVKGKATFEIFWCDFSVGFNKTLISGQPPPRPERIVVMERLKAALSDARNWGGQLAEGERRLVSLRERRLPNEIALHPLGKLSVKQSVVPLELEIAKFSHATPADARLFKISKVSLNNTDVGFARVSDFFAPAEFLEMTDDEKLAAPSFEPMTAGVSLDEGGFILSADASALIIDDAIGYETIIIDKKNKLVQKAPTLTPLNPAYLNRQISFGAAARSEVRRNASARYRPAAAKNRTARTGWVVVSAAEGTPQGVSGIEAGKLVSYAEAFQAVQKLKQANPAKAKGLRIIRATEPSN